MIVRTEYKENGNVEIAARQSKLNGVLCSLRIVCAGMARKINCFCLLVVYTDAETMVPPGALVTCNQRSGLRVITLPSMAAGLGCVATNYCHCCRPATNTLQPLLIMGIWCVIAFLLSPFVPAHFCLVNVGADCLTC